MITRRLARPLLGRVARLAEEGGRLARRRGQHARRPISRRGPLNQARIAGQPDDVLDPRGLQEVQEGIAGKAPVQAYAQARLREGRAQLGEQAPQQADRPAGGRPGTLPQHRGHQVLHPLVVERQGAHERQVAPGIVVPVEEGQLLLPVGGIVGGIEVDRDPPHRPAPRRRWWLAMTVSARASPKAYNSPRRTAFSNRDSVGCEPRAAPVRGIAIHQQLVDRIVGQPRSVVAVGVATGDAEHALAHQLQELMPHLARLPGIAQGVGQSRRQTERGVDRLEEDGAAIIATAWATSKRASTGLEFCWNRKVVCAIQSVAIEPPCVGA